MKIIASILLLAAAQCAIAQSNAVNREQSDQRVKTAPMYTALYVLRSDLRTIELDPKKNEMFDVKSIDKKFVRFVTILNGKEGKKIYGEKGANGVVIVQLEDRFDLSKASLISSAVDD